MLYRQPTQGIGNGRVTPPFKLHASNAFPSILSGDILLHLIKCVNFPVHPLTVVRFVANQYNQLGRSVEFPFNLIAYRL